jgi:adenylate cyclase
MVFEIERKFLLRKIPINIDWDFIYSIKQYYISDYRMRIQTNTKNGEIKWFYTKKTATDNHMVYNEIEREVTYDEFWKYISNRESKIVQKTRYVKYFGDDKLKVEVDDFIGMKLVVAEVELPSVDYNLLLPDFIIHNMLIEVTNYKEFKNKELAI